MADVTFTIEFSSNGDVVLKNVSNSVTEAKSQFDRFVPAADAGDRSLQRVVKSAVGAAAGIADLGPAGNIAARAIEAMTLAAGPAALAFGAVAAAVGFVTFRVQQAREALARLAERELADLERQKDLLTLDQAFRRQIRELQSLDPELTAIAQKYEQVRIAAEKQGASLETLARIDKVAELERNKILAERQAQAARAQQQIQQEIIVRQLEAAAIGRTGSALDALNLAQRLNAIETRQLAGEHGALLRQLAEEEVVAFRLKRAFDNIASGNQALDKFSANFGVQFDFQRQIAGRELAANFAAVFNAFKNDPQAATQLNQAFASLIQQALALGLPNISGLLASVGISSNDLARLMQDLAQVQIGFREVEQTVPVFVQNALGGMEKIGEEIATRLIPAFGQELVAAINQSDQSLFRWTTDFESGLIKNTVRAGAIGAQLDRLHQSIESIAVATAQQMSLNIDVSQALSAAQQAKAAIDAIPDVTLKQIIFQVFYAASPARSFSQFLPFMRETFGELESMIASATPDVLLRVQGLPALTRAIEDLEEQRRQIGLTPVHRPGTPFFASVNPMTSGAVFLSDFERQRQLDAVERQLENARFALGSAIASAAGSGGGGQGGVNVTIDLRGSTMSRDFLDDELIPALERGIIRATGADPTLRVLN